MRRPCCEKEGINKGAWSKQEDRKLIDYINAHGEGCWRSLPKAAGLHRCGKSCRLRWINYLRPDIKRGSFAQDEEDLIIKLHALLGNRWSLIAGRLPGRTDNEVKNYWNSHLRKKLIRMGIDPNNHRPHQRLPLPPPTSHNSQITHLSGSMEEASKPTSNDNNCLDSTTSPAPCGISRLVINCIDHDPLDLNLDLTIAMPPSPHPQGVLGLEKNKGEDSSNVADVGFQADQAEPSPTLILFG